MIKGTSEYLTDIAKKYVCSEHLTQVNVAWHDEEKSYVLRCGGKPRITEERDHDGEDHRVTIPAASHYPEEVKPKESPTKLTKTGKLEPAGDWFNLMPKADLGTGEVLQPALINILRLYAQKYALDVFRGHVVIFHGKPYIGLDGYLYHANKSGRAYALRSRPLTDEERNAYQVVAGDHAWLSEVVFADDNTSFTGLGIVTQEEMTAKSKRDKDKLASPVVAAHPWQLAQKRGDWQALRRAFPIGNTEEIKEE